MGDEVDARRSAAFLHGAGHYRALIVSEAFAGLNRVARQRLVFQAVDEMMGPDIHALAMRTLTPEEWRDA